MNGDFGRTHSEENIRRSEEVLTHYLAQAPLSYSLWRTLEYQQLGLIDLPEPVLDLGCGDGIFSSILLNGKTAVGMDINLSEIMLARRFSTHIGMTAAHAGALPFMDNSFSSVISNCVLEHIPGIENVFSEVARVLKPGGIFVYTVPSEYFTTTLFYTSIFNRVGLKPVASLYGYLMNRVLGHVNILSIDEWSNLAVSVGLEIVNKRYFIPPQAIAVFDFFMPFSLVSFLKRRLFGRWSLFPPSRLVLGPIIFRLIKNLIRIRPEQGGCALIIARKAES